MFLNSLLVPKFPTISNYLTNPDFETGNLSPWTNTGSGSTTVITSPRTGVYAARCFNLGYISQTLNNLEPNRVYVLSLYVKSNTGTSQTFTTGYAGKDDVVREFSRTATTSWAIQNYYFTVRNNTNEATVYSYANANQDILFDDISLSSLETVPVNNSSFETGSFTGWTTSGTTSINSSLFRNGRFAAKLSNGATVQQTITGLLFNTSYNYIISVRSETNVSQAFSLGVSNFSVVTNATSLDSSWKIYARSFTTSGSDNTSTFYVTAGSGTNIILDDIYLIKT